MCKIEQIHINVEEDKYNKCACNFYFFNIFLIQGSHCSLSEEGLGGLQEELKRRMSQLRSHLFTVRENYLKVVQAGLDGSALDLEEEEEQLKEQDLPSDVESNLDEEDMDMQVIKDMILYTNYVPNNVMH